MDVLGLSLVLGITVVLLFLGVLERRLHERRLRSFRIRVHVNGTRGKSSVTRLIAAGLRAGGVRTVAKTTGTLPRLIHPDAVEEPIYRVGAPNVIEQLAAVRRARHLSAEAVVIECMALQPFLQWVSTSALVQPTVGVITNVRADHLDVMGPGARDVALALAGSIPQGVPTYTAEHKFGSVLEKVARDRKSQLTCVLPDDPVHAVSEAELAEFRYIEHAENVALALRVCADLGVSRDTALRGMQAARPDPGALTISVCEGQEGRFWLVNGFAANDPESSETVWELSKRRVPRARRHIALINCRADRADRSVQLGEACVSWTPADHYLLCGTGSHFFRAAAQRAGLDPVKVVSLEEDSPALLARRLSYLAGEDGLVVGLGNIGGTGLALLRALTGRAA